MPIGDALIYGNVKPTIPQVNQLMRVVIEQADEGRISAMYNHTIGPKDKPKPNTNSNIKVIYIAFYSGYHSANKERPSRQIIHINSPKISIIFLPNLSINLPPNKADNVNKKPMTAVMILAVSLSLAVGCSP